MGKTKRYEVKNPNDPASDGQTYALYTICGVDVRELELLAGNASDLIDTAKNGQSRHVRMALLEAGGIVRTRDVHKNYRSDPKPRGYKVADTGNGKKAKGNGKAKSDEEILLALIAKKPGLLKKALETLAGADVSEKPAKAKAKAPKVEVKTGAKAKAPKKPKVEKPDEDEDASDDDLLAQLTAAIKKAS